MGNILLIAQFVISGFLLYSIFRLGVIPGDLFLYIAIIVILLMLLTTMGRILGRRRKVLRITMSVMCILISGLFAVAGAYMWKSDGFIKDVGNGSEERYGISVVVMKDSTAEDIDDLKDATFAYVDKSSGSMLEEGVREIKSALGPMKTIHPANPVELADLLYSGECDAAIIEESNRSMITDEHFDFELATRTIWNHEITQTIASEDSGLDVTRDSFNIFLCGSDSRSSVEEVALNDLNMIVTVNPVTNQILLTSIPRDYYIELASYGAKDKLTHAGIFGTEEAVKTVEKFTGLKMDFYVKVSFAALVYVVDAMGGIDVESDTEFTAWTNPDVHIEKGWNHMDGVTALAYARERYAYEDGDIHRAQNQAQVLREVAWRAMSPGILIHYDKLLDALAKGMKTSMSDEQIRSLIKMQLDKKAQWDIADYQMKGKNAVTKKCYSMWGKKLYIMKPDQASVDEALGYIEEFMNGEIQDQ
ncbi:MAG: hypothetical protein E7220_02000 [Clostridiales bacterium]|nr:hypothetical protein [Clostridiales bacterium]